MPNYRRAFVRGGCYFFTVNLLDRNSCLLVDHIDSLRSAVRDTRRAYPFEIDAMLILPDHIHAVWTLPEGDADFSVRWRWIKIRFSRSTPKGERLHAVRTARGERGIWQRRYWEHVIRDESDLNNHIDYCWFNPVKHGPVKHGPVKHGPVKHGPVKHGHVKTVEDWPYSSFHRDHRDAPKPGDFEQALAEYALKNPGIRFSERE